MFFTSKKVIGVDLGSSSIKFSQVSKSKGAVTLENFAFIQTPPHTINNGDMVETLQLGETLKRLQKENKFSAKNVCVGMWGASAIVKKITMPKVEAKALKEQIKYEAQQYLPFDISQVAIDYHVLPFSSSPEQMDVLIVAGQIELITKYIETMAYGQLKTSIVDVSSLALSNIFELNYGKLNEPIGLFNFGSTNTQFVVVFQGEVLFARDIPIGGSQFTHEIAKSMNVTPEEAESLKLSLASGQDTPENLRSSMNIGLANILEEIKNSLDFYAASGGDFQIHRAYYTGGASLSEGLIDYLSQNLKMNFEILNPFLKIKTNSKKFNPQYLSQITPFVAVSLGLALREAGDS